MTNFSLKNMGNWTLEDLDNMMFWEREIYVNILAEHNKKQKNNSNEMDIGLYYG